MKNELLKDKRFGSIEEVRAAVEAAVRFYNEERPHMSIDMLTRWVLHKPLKRFTFVPESDIAMRG